MQSLKNFYSIVKKDYLEIVKDLKFNLSWLSNRTLTSEILTVLVTKRCNLNCTYCWDYDNRPKLKEMKTEHIKKIIDDAYKIGIRIFNPLGGEPFIRHDIMEILEYAFSKDMKVTLTTNGTLLTEERIKRLIAAAPHDRLVVLVSLDGTTAEENDRIRGAGSFAKTTRCLAALNRERAKYDKWVSICINNVVSRNNFRSMPKMAKMVKELGADIVLFITPQVSSNEVKRGMTEQNLFILPEEFGELDEAIDTVLKIKKSTDLVLNNHESLNNFKQYYRRQYQQNEAQIRAGQKPIEVECERVAT